MKLLTVKQAEIIFICYSKW